MEIVIHGTKKGRKILTPNEIGGLLDVTPDSPKIKAIGENAYAIRFINNNIIFSKYKIIKDVLGEKRIGFMGFSLFLSNKEKLSGEHIIALLDRVSEEYCTRYIIDNNWNQVTEDWDFVKSLSREYESKLSTVSIEDSENIQSGVLDEAFVYFYNDTELQKYFNQPYQEEYEPFRQIFFLSNKLKDKPENPLNALRNSGKDLTGVIDLENPSFRLREFHGNEKNGISITIKNSKGRQLYNKDKIFKKEELTIVYSKKNYKEKKIIGSLLNSEEIRNHLNISNDSKIDVLKVVELESEVKSISFEVVKKDGSRVMDAVLKYKNNFQPEKQVLNNQVTFSGEDLNEKWIVSAKHGDSYFSDNILIDFDKDTINPIKITLNEKRVLKIVAKEYESPQNRIPEFKVFIQGKGNYNENDIEFVDDEINKTFNITVESQGYKRSDIQTYHPKEGNKTLYFQLKKNHKTIGDSKNNEKDIDLVSKKTENDKSWYQKPKLIFVSIASVLILSIGIWGLIHFIIKPKPHQKLISLEQINNYLESDNLILDTLKFYQVNLEKQNPQNKTKDKGFLGSLLSNNENSNISYETDNWNQISDSVVSAISKRELIDKKDFEELKKIHFNHSKSFEKIIHDIKKNKYEFLKEKLGDISSLSLSEIEYKIEEILNEQDSENGSTDLASNQVSKTAPQITKPSKSSVGKRTGSLVKNEQKDAVNNGEIQSVESVKDRNNNNSISSSKSDDSGIIERLKSGDITGLDLDKYRNNTKKMELIKSINLLSELWDIESSNNSCEKYLTKINNNEYLNKNNVLKNIVSQMKSRLKDSKSWGRFSKSESLNKILERIKK